VAKRGDVHATNDGNLTNHIHAVINVFDWCWAPLFRQPATAHGIEKDMRRVAEEECLVVAADRSAHVYYKEGVDSRLQHHWKHWKQ
jgi:hypothetical protein